MFYKFVFPEEKEILFSRYPNIATFSFTKLEKASATHQHPHTEIVVPQNDFGMLCFNQNTVEMRRGNFYVIPSNISHSEKNKADCNPAQYFILKIKDVFPLSQEMQYPLIIEEKRFYELNAYLQNAFSALTESHDEPYAVLNLTCFYYAFMEIVKKRQLLGSSTKTRALPQLTQEVEWYLSQNYGREIKIEELAQSYGISHCTLINNFKKHIGVTPKQYLLNRRIQAAKELVLFSDFSITQIAAYCGFASPSYFTYLFKNATSFTPKEYREKYTTK